MSVTVQKYFRLSASIGCQRGSFLFLLSIDVEGVPQFFERCSYRGCSCPSRLLILILGGKIDNRDLILGRADRFVRVGAVSAQEIRVVHFGLDGEAEVGG